MKKLLIALGASTALVSMPAMAADSSESFDVTASVPESCLMEDIADVDLGEVDIIRSSGADALLLESNSTGNTGDFYISCNLPSNVEIVTANGALTNQTQSLTGSEIETEGFTDKIEYRVALDNYDGNGGGPKLVTKDGDAGYSVMGSSDAMHRQVSGRVTILRADNNGARPLSGSYADTVTINVTSI